MATSSPQTCGDSTALPDGITWALILDVLDVFEAAGFRRGDDQHTGQAIALIGKAARVYAGGEP